MARRQSVDAAVALGELRSAYWQWRSYRADLLPEVSLSGTLPSYNKRYSSYQQADGGLSFVRNDYLGLDGSLNIKQKLWPTGGTLSVESSLDYLHQTGSGMGSSNQLMSLPVAITLSQPLFGTNHQKWNRRISPDRTCRQLINSMRWRRPSVAWVPSARTTCCKCASMCSPPEAH